MTEQQKSVIKTLRQQNFSYNAIANTLGLTISTVKSYCQRNGLAGNRKEHSGAILLSHRYCLLSANAAASRSPKRKKLNAASSVLMNAV